DPQVEDLEVTNQDGPARKLGGAVFLSNTIGKRSRRWLEDHEVDTLFSLIHENELWHSTFIISGSSLPSSIRAASQKPPQPSISLSRRSRNPSTSWSASSTSSFSSAAADPPPLLPPVLSCTGGRVSCSAWSAPPNGSCASCAGSSAGCFGLVPAPPSRTTCCPPYSADFTDVIRVCTCASRAPTRAPSFNCSSRPRSTWRWSKDRWPTRASRSAPGATTR